MTISGFLISNRLSPLLFISKVSAVSIPVEPADPSHYGCSIPACCSLRPTPFSACCPQLTVPQHPMNFGLMENSLFLCPSHLQQVPHCPGKSGRNLHYTVERLPSPAVRVGDVGALMSGTLRSWLALSQKENSLEITSGIPTAVIAVSRKFLMARSF